MAKTYKRKLIEEKEKEVNELIEKANAGIEKCFTTSEQIKELASYMSRFYNYSLRNTFLIQEQFEGALAVGSYVFWKEKGFTVNKGEKGIKILVPNKLSDYFINEKGEEVKLKYATKEEKKLIEQGEIEVRQGKLIFNKGYVFEVSQTNAKAEDLPKIFPNKWLEGNIKNYDLMYKAMENIAKKIGVKIIEPKTELGAVKGVSYSATKEVALNPRNTQLQNVKTLIHELTHAKLHTKETRDNYTTNAKEFQAEMAAYVVCSYFGLDTSEYSFRYINSWTKDVELKDKEKLINEVREIVKEYIEVIEKTLVNDKDLSLSLETENTVEKKIEDEKLIDFLGKDRVVINEITKDELEKIINENNSNVYLQKDKELSIKNEIVAIESKGKYKDVYIGTVYGLDKLIYIDDNKNLYKIKKNIEYDKNLYEIKEQEVMEENVTYELKSDIDYNLKLESYFNEKNIDIELRNKLSKNERFKELLDGKIYLENNINDLKKAIEFYSQDSEYKGIESLNTGLNNELRLNEELKSYISKEINRVAGVEIEEVKHKEKEYTIASDLELEDGSFIKKGTSFFIEDFRNREFEVHFEASDDNIYVPNEGEGTGFYFTEHEISIYSDLDKTVDLLKKPEVILENENWILSEEEIKDAEIELMKDNIEQLMDKSHSSFVKALILIETGIEDLKLLDNIYDKYMDRDFNLINDRFEDLKNELGKENLEMRDEKKEKEIWKKIREHEEWVKSNGLRGQQLNLENENLKGMRLINLDLREANFKGADMTQCIVYADLRGADLTGAKIDNSEWIGSNINNVTIEANKLNLIEYQMEQEKDLHLSSMDKLKTKEKEKEMSM